MYQLPELAKFPKLLHAFSEVSEGNMSFRWGSREEVEKNRAAFLQKLRVPFDSCVNVGVHHGVSVGRADASHRGQGMAHGDTREMPEALLTDEPGTYLFLLTGDCLPVIFHDVQRGVVGLAHASRHNTPKFLMTEVVRKMKEWYSSDPKGIVVGIGPGTRKESYLFPPAMCETFTPVWEEFVRNRDSSGCALDVVGWNVAQLCEAGVRKEHIAVAPHDTLADVRFFSHARSRMMGETEGRFATVVGMRNKRP